MRAPTDLRRIAVLLTRATTWDDPQTQGANLARFLADMVQPRAGRAFLRVRKSATAPAWVSGDAASEWVAGQLARWSKPIDDPLPVHYRTMLAESANVFLDPAALHAWLGAHGHDLPRIEALLVHATWSLDWSVADLLSLAPQLGLWNYEPEFETLAPPGPKAVPSATPAAVAAAVLEDDLALEIASTVAAVRSELGVAADDRPIGSFILHDPSFYLAESTSMPTAALDWLGPQHPETSVLAQRCLGTDLVGTEAVEVADFDRGFLVLRREPGLDAWRGRAPDGDETIDVRAYFLMLPYGSLIASWGSVEQQATFIADKLSFVATAGEISAMAAHHRHREITAESGLGSVLMDRALATVDDLQQIALLSPGRAASALGAMRRLQLAFTRMEADLNVAAGSSAEAVEELQSEAAKSEAFIHNSTGARAIPGYPAIGPLGPQHLILPWLANAASGAARVAERYRELAASLDRGLALAQSGVDERRARGQLYLSIAVAILAGVAASPLLIGQEDFSGLTEAISHQPQVGPALAAGLETARPVLSVLGAIAAAAAIALLVILAGAALWAVVRPKAASERRLARLMQLQRDALVLLDGSRSRDSGKRLAVIDRTASNLLATLMDELTEDSGRGSKRRRSPAEHARRFVLLAELMGQRKRQLPLPLTMALYRYRSRALLGADVVSHAEFQFSMYRIGCVEDVEKFDQVAATTAPSAKVFLAKVAAAATCEPSVGWTPAAGRH